MTDTDLVHIITGEKSRLQAIITTDYPTGVHGRTRAKTFYDTNRRRMVSVLANDCSSKRDHEMEPLPDQLRPEHRERPIRSLRSYAEGRNTILDYVRENGPATLTEISEATGELKDRISYVMRGHGGIAGTVSRGQKRMGGTERTWELPGEPEKVTK